MGKGKTERKELTAEIASRKEEARFYGDVLPNPDKVLATRGRGRSLDLYDDLELDAHVRTVVAKRKRAVTSREWAVNEGGDGERAGKAAELVRACLEKINFDKVTEDMLDAVLKGYSVGEIIWSYDEELGILRPAEVRSRKPQRFVFKLGENGYELRLLTLESPFDGIALPDKKFMVYTHERRFDNPYGFALGGTLFWPVYFKRKGITFWLTFCDKFGSPTTIGKYPAGASETERETLREALECIANDYGITVPEGMDVSLLEASKSSTDTYERLARFMDEQISEAVLGETGTTNQTGEGSRAKDEVGNGVRLETAKADADSVCQTINETLVKWIIDLNMPGAPAPKVWRIFDQAEDLSARANRDAVLANMGVKFSKDYFRNAYNLEDGDFELVETGGELSAPIQFSEGGANEGELLLPNLDGKDIKRQMNDLPKGFVEAVESGKSYGEALKGLSKRYEYLSSETLQELLDNAIFLSDAWGRLNAKQKRD